MSLYVRGGSPITQHQQRIAALELEAAAAEQSANQRIAAAERRVAEAERQAEKNLAKMGERIEKRRAEVTRCRLRLKSRKRRLDSLNDKIDAAIVESERRLAILTDTTLPEPEHGGRAGLEAATRELLEHEKEKRLRARQNNP